MPLKALNNFGTGRLIGADDLPQVFRVKLTGERGGVYEVAEHDGELAAFRLGKMWGMDNSSGRSSLHRRSRCRGGILWHKQRGAGSLGHGRRTRPHQDT